MADNFLAFWLSVIEPHRPAISRRLGRSIADVLPQQFDDFMGDRWEEAFRAHLADALADDQRFYPMVEMGRFWKQYGPDPCEMDAVVLSGRERRLTLSGEANGDPDPVYALCARERVSGELPPETLVVTATDIVG